MDKDRYLEILQAVLDAISPYFLKGCTGMLTAEAVMACAKDLPPEWVAVAQAIPKEDRDSVSFRSGGCAGYSKHAGQKERNNSEAKMRSTSGRGKYDRAGSFTSKVEVVISKAGSPGLHSRRISEELRVGTEKVATALDSLLKQKRVERKPIPSTTRGGPRFAYFIPTMAEKS